MADEGDYSEQSDIRRRVFLRNENPEGLVQERLARRMQMICFAPASFTHTHPDADDAVTSPLHEAG
jgi:hypothetical protein